MNFKIALTACTWVVGLVVLAPLAVAYEQGTAIGLALIWSVAVLAGTGIITITASDLRKDRSNPFAKDILRAKRTRSKIQSEGGPLAKAAQDDLERLINRLNGWQSELRYLSNASEVEELREELKQAAENTWRRVEACRAMQNQ